MLILKCPGGCRWEFWTAGFASSLISNQNRGYRRTPQTGLCVREEDIRICFKRRKKVSNQEAMKVYEEFSVYNKNPNKNFKLGKKKWHSMQCKLIKLNSSSKCWIKVRSFRWIDTEWELNIFIFIKSQFPKELSKDK